MTTIARPNQHHREEVTQRRRALQYLLDRKRSKEERNRLGQFATPDQLALDVAQHALSYFLIALLSRCWNLRWDWGAFGRPS